MKGCLPKERKNVGIWAIGVARRRGLFLGNIYYYFFRNYNPDGRYQFF